MTILLATLVTYGSQESLSEQKKKYHVLSNIIHNLAQGVRVGDGYRLLKHCVCHTMDPLAPHLIRASRMIFEYDDDLGICTEHEIKASMKNKLYANKVAFTKSGIVCCSCDCPSGAVTESGHRLSKHLCVHCLPNLFSPYTISILRLCRTLSL